MSKQRDQVLDVLQSPSNLESTVEDIGKDIKALDASDP
jgi:hypothetical protein